MAWSLIGKKTFWSDLVTFGYIELNFHGSERSEIKIWITIRNGGT